MLRPRGLPRLWAMHFPFFIDGGSLESQGTHFGEMLTWGPWQGFFLSLAAASQKNRLCHLIFFFFLKRNFLDSFPESTAEGHWDSRLPKALLESKHCIMGTAFGFGRAQVQSSHHTQSVQYNYFWKVMNYLRFSPRKQGITLTHWYIFGPKW